jgi:hypothetical protein
MRAGGRAGARAMRDFLSDLRLECSIVSALRLLEPNVHDTLVDLGCGDGRNVIIANPCLATPASFAYDTAESAPFRRSNALRASVARRTD